MTLSMNNKREVDRRFMLQKMLVGFYGLVQSTGLLKIKPVQNMYHMAYFAYKKHLEDPFWNFTKRNPNLFIGGMIMDIGAHIGYTSYVFSNVVDRDCQVHAFEPDASNFSQMEDMIQRNNLQEFIIPVLSAVGKENGEIEFWRNADHPGDNRVVTPTFAGQGINNNNISRVKVWSVDSYIDEMSITAPIVFIKIDVQGYEIPVCKGMIQTLKKYPDCVLAVEFEPATLRAMGFDPDELMTFLKERFGNIYTLNKNGRLGLGSSEHIESIVSKRGYVDLVCSKRVINTTD